MYVNEEAGVAVVTPTFRRDLVWSTWLNASVLEFFPDPIKHYLIVDRRDVPLFQHLANKRTVVVALEDVVPGGFRKLPFFKNRWAMRATVAPVNGWVVQQVAKIAIASKLTEETLVIVDSDVTFVRPVNVALFRSAEGKSRLYCEPKLISSDQVMQVTWHKQICGLLGISPDAAPLRNYVGNMISWDRRLVLRMCTHIEASCKEPWYIAFARARYVSEYLTYGTFSDTVLGAEANVWLDNRSWCHTYWERVPIDDEQMRRFVDQMPNDDVAFSIAGYSGTDDSIRLAALEIIKSNS